MEGYVRIGPHARAALYGALFMDAITFLFGLDYGDTLLAMVAMGSAMLGLVSLAILHVSGTEREQQGAGGRLEPIIRWIAYSLGAFALLDAFVPRFFSLQFLGLPLASSLTASSIPASDYISIGLIFTMSEAVVEGLLYQVAIVNASLKFLRAGSVLVALFAAGISGFLFGVSHIPAYGLDGPVLTILGLAGVVLATGAIRTGEAITPVVPHVINNFFAWFNAALIVAGGTAMAFLPATAPQALLFVSALASVPLGFLFVLRLPRIGPGTGVK